MDCYKVLRISPTASKEEVEKAAEILISIWNPEDFDDYKEVSLCVVDDIKKAKRILTDPESRKKHDEERKKSISEMEEADSKLNVEICSESGLYGSYNRPWMGSRSLVDIYNDSKAKYVTNKVLRDSILDFVHHQQNAGLENHSSGHEDNKNVMAEQTQSQLSDINKERAVLDTFRDSGYETKENFSKDSYLIGENNKSSSGSKLENDNKENSTSSKTIEEEKPFSINKSAESYQAKQYSESIEISMNEERVDVQVQQDKYSTNAMVSKTYNKENKIANIKVESEKKLPASSAHSSSKDSNGTAIENSGSNMHEIKYSLNIPATILRKCVSDTMICTKLEHYAEFLNYNNLNSIFREIMLNTMVNKQDAISDKTGTDNDNNSKTERIINAEMFSNLRAIVNQSFLNCPETEKSSADSVFPSTEKVNLDLSMLMMYLEEISKTEPQANVEIMKNHWLSVKNVAPDSSQESVEYSNGSNPKPANAIVNISIEHFVLHSDENFTTEEGNETNNNKNSSKAVLSKNESDHSPESSSSENNTVIFGVSKSESIAITNGKFLNCLSILKAETYQLEDEDNDNRTWKGAVETSYTIEGEWEVISTSVKLEGFETKTKYYFNKNEELRLEVFAEDVLKCKIVNNQAEDVDDGSLKELFSIPVPLTMMSRIKSDGGYIVMVRDLAGLQDMIKIYKNTELLHQFCTKNVCKAN